MVVLFFSYDTSIKQKTREESSNIGSFPFYGKDATPCNISLCYCGSVDKKRKGLAPDLFLFLRSKLDVYIGSQGWGGFHPKIQEKGADQWRNQKLNIG